MHRKRIREILLLVLFPLLALGQKRAVVLVDRTFTHTYIGSGSLHRTGTGFLEIDDPKGNWEAIQTKAYWLSPGEIHWIATTLKNIDTVDCTMKWYFNNIQAGDIKMYIRTAHSFDSSKSTGSLIPLQKRATSDRFFSIPFTLHAGETATIYIKTKRKGIGITTTPALYKLPAEQSDWTDKVMLVVITIVFIILLAAAYVLVFFPSKEIGWFFTYILFGMLYTLAASGFGSMYVWSGYPVLEENAAVFFGSISTASLLVFSCLVLNIFQTNRLLYYSITGIALLYVLAGSAGYLFYAGYFNLLQYPFLLAIPYLLILLCFAVLLIISMYKSFTSQKKYWWFFAIFLSFFVMAVYLTLLELGIIPFDYQLHPLIFAFGALPQMLLSLIYLIFQTIAILKQRSNQIHEQKIKTQQALLDERFRISQDLHDEVGATLSGIAMYSHLSKDQLSQERLAQARNSLNIIQDSASEMVNKLNDIVWLTNPNQDELKKLLQRLEEYAFQMTAVKNIQLNSNFGSMESSMALNSDTRRNIYLIFKEAINNAVKYSNAVVISLQAEITKEKIELCISDNGDGFDKAKSMPGNGLKNIHNRALDLNAHCSITAAPGNGTTIRFVLKIPQ
jgi:signal transduction histidine kinase